MSESVDAAAVRRWCAAGLDALRRHRSEIDALNVYPVPDGDTGTNLALTMSAATAAVDGAPGSLSAAELLAVAARGALLGARGNSGIILAQLLKGLASSLASARAIGPAELAVALDRAAWSAYAAVAAPVEGTVLSVASAAARAAADAAARFATAAAPAAADSSDRAASGLGTASAGAAVGSAAASPGVAGGLDAAASGAVDGSAAASSGAVDGSDAAASGTAAGSDAASSGAVDGLDAAAPGTAAGLSAAVSGAVGGLDGVVAVARAAAEGARVALARTPEQLPALARAGVVDAGGRGLVVLLEAFVTALTGEEPPDSPAAPVGVDATPGGVMEREAGSVEFGYEVQFLLDAPARAIEPLREALGALGDSLVVIGDDPTWHVHVHVNDVGAAIEAGIEAGRPSRITVTRFAEQIAEQRAARELQLSSPGSSSTASSTTGSTSTGSSSAGASSTGQSSTGSSFTESFSDGRSSAGPVPAGAVAGRSSGSAELSELSDLDESAGAGAAGSGVVVVCSGQGIGDLLAAEGATVLTGTPSTGEVLAAIRATGAHRVVILPNDANVLAVANAAAAEARAGGIRAGVVPTRSPVQALAAMAVRDTRRRFEDDVIAMAEAAARCRSAELTVAAREALTVAGRCQPGDVLAIVDGEINLIGKDLERTACLLLDRMLLAGGELVTLIAGQGAPPGLGETLQGHVAGAWPFVEVQCYEGGQPHYPLLVGVE